MSDFPPSTLEIDIAINRRVYGFGWYHAPAKNGHVFAFLAPEQAEPATFTPIGQPTVFSRNGVQLHLCDGRQVGYVWSEHMLHPSTNTTDAWRILRYLSGEHRLRLLTTSEEPTDSTPGSYIVAFLHRASGLGPVVRIGRPTFEQAACAAALELADWADAKASAVQPPAAGQA